MTELFVIAIFAAGIGIAMIRALYMQRDAIRILEAKVEALTHHLDLEIHVALYHDRVTTRTWKRGEETPIDATINSIREAQEALQRVKER